MGDTTPTVGTGSGFQNLLSTLFLSPLSSTYKQENGYLIFDLVRRLLVAVTQNPATAQRMVERSLGLRLSCLLLVLVLP